jgi:hypothetical protein
MTDYSRSNILLPHFEEAEAFLTALAGQDAPFTFQTFDDVKVWSEEKQKFINRQAPNLARIFQGTLNQHKQALAALNAKGAGVYVTVNQTDLKGRSLANIVKVRALFVDLDGSPIQPILDLPEDLQPHIIIESSPNKWHAYWLVNNCELEQFKQLQQALAAKFNGDKAVNDLPRVMRLAGFSHNKAESFITRIHTMQDNLYPYSVNKLIVGLGLNNNKKEDTQGAVVAVVAVDDDFTMGLPPEADVIADLKSALEYLSCEDYHDWIRQAMRLKTLGDTGLELFLSWSSKGSTFERVDAIHKWRGLHADRTGYKAIFNEAKANGWTNPLSSHKPPKTAKADPIDPDLINKTIEALPTPEERNTARALQSALQAIALQDFIGDSAIPSSKIIGYGLSHEYKQAQGSIGALLAIDWDKRTGGNAFSNYRAADLKHDNPIKVASIYKLAQSKGWVMPADQDNTIETHRNAPRGNAAMLYGIFGEFGRAAAKNTEVNQYAAAMNLMIYLSASVGRGIYFYIGNDVHHVRLYGLHIGRSSRGQKGGAHSLLNRVIRVITESDDLQLLLPSRHTGGLSSKEGLAALIHDGYMQGKEEVAPITDKRLFIRESEFSNVMHQAARNGNTLSAGLRDAWDGVGIQPATKLKGTWASHPHIAIAGACTPVELLALTTKNDVSNGFLNRFIIFWAERTKLIPFPDSTPIDTVNLLATKIKAIIQFAKGNYVWDKNPSLASEDNRQITLSDDAKRTYGALYINVFPKYNDGDKVTALTERKAPYLLRMAALFAISDFSLVIEEWHINAAYEWVKYWHESVKFIFNDAAEEVKNNEISDRASKIIDYLASKDKGYQATRTELSNEVFNRHLDSKKLDEALNTLITSTPPKIEVIESNRPDGMTSKRTKFYMLCELRELCEVTTAARVGVTSHFAKSLRSDANYGEPTQKDAEIENQTSQNSHDFANVRSDSTPTARSNFAEFAEFAEVKKKIDIFTLTKEDLHSNTYENAPIVINDKKVSCNECEHYAWDCVKGIEVIDENALHNCTHYECVF